MFDISFSELVVIGIVALVVIGPERLPGVARTLGHLLGRAQRYVSDVKADIRREIQLDELKKIQSQMAESAQTLEETMQRELAEARSIFASPAASALADLEATAQQAAALPADTSHAATTGEALQKPERPAA